MLLSLVAGALLALGAWTATAQAEEHRQEGTWSPGGGFQQSRLEHTASLLPDGRVLLVGGRDTSNNDPRSVEIWDPSTRSSQLIAPMEEGRRHHTATRLDDDRILVTGGNIDGHMASAAIFDPGTQEWTPADSMAYRRSEHVAARLPGGRVLVAGGIGGPAGEDGSDVLATAEIYDPGADEWTQVGDMSTKRVDHTVTPLEGGGVLVAGGVAEQSFFADDLASTEIFHPDSDEPGAGSWKAAAPMEFARSGHAAARLDDGKVLVAGRADGGDVEIYDPGGQTWDACSDASETPACPANEGFVGHTVTVLDDGTVLVAGYVGETVAERYDPVDDQWWAADTPELRHLGHTATLLENGHVFTAGGSRSGDSEVYSPQTVPGPVVESVTPRRGSVDGRFEVTVTGENLSDAIFVAFGDYRVTSITEVSADELRVEAPEHPAGWTPVRVATPGGWSEVDETLQVEFFATDGEWGPTGAMAAERREGGAVVLDGPACDNGDAPAYCGQALVVSGDTSELYDPDEGRFHSLASLPSSIETQRRTTVLDGPDCRGESPPEHCGQVLVLDRSTAGKAALYDPANNEWQACGEGGGFDCPPSLEREDSNDFQWYATELLDGPECHDADGEAPDHCGTVLAAAPLPFGGGTPPQMWLFEPADGTWTQTTSPDEPRSKHVMTLIEGEACEGDARPNACGDVLISSGVENVAGEGIRTTTAELYDPADRQWRDTAEDPPTPGRDWSTATTLPDGRVLVAGGHLDFQGASAQADLFNPVDESWEPVPAMPDARRRHSAVTLPDGRAMLAGGHMTTPAGSAGVTPSVLVFDPDEAAWSYTDSMLDARAAGSGDHWHTGFPLVTLPDERVLAAGGRDDAFNTHASTELYSLNPGSVAGLVLDAGTGDPVDGAEVTVTDVAGSEVGSATTSADGTYQVTEVPFGSYTVTADATGYDPVSRDGVTVDAGETTRLDFALAESTTGGGGGVITEPADGLVAGTVTDAESGQTLGGVEVTVDGPTTATTTTDADGAYQLAGLTAGSYTVTADTDGYEAASQSVEVVEGEAATADFALQPEAAAAGATGSVAGTVTDAGSGEAVPGAEVTVTDTAGSVVVTAGTDTSGAYTAEGLAPGDYTLTAEATGYESASQSVTVVAGETAAADFALQPVPDGDEPTTALGDLTSAQLVQSACDPAAVPDAGFGDVAGSVHEEAVACVAWYGLTLGLGDLDGDGQVDYGPNRPVTRDQMASFIARLAVEAGVDLPEDVPDAFGDDDGSVHEEAINQLAALGLVRGVEEGRYVPRAPVTRDQMASFLARLAGEAGLALTDGPPDAFGDDDGSVHEDNINALAAANITRGVSEGVYAPRNPVSRGQMASFLGRLLGGFVETGIAPEGGAEVTLDSTSTTSGGQLAGEVFAHKDVVSLTADGCGLSERDLSVAADGEFTVSIPDDQPAGDCELTFAVSTTRGGDAPVQTARYGFAVTVDAGGA